MTVPTVPLTDWLLVGLDPFLIAVAVLMGWTADQIGKLVLAMMAAFVASILAGWAITSLGLPWFAPVGADEPLLIQARLGFAVLWSGAAYGARKLTAKA